MLMRFMYLLEIGFISNYINCHLHTVKKKQINKKKNKEKKRRKTFQHKNMKKSPCQSGTHLN